jgi:alkylation response protein AidB-like acyl-CoA dehydrogenase
MELSYGAQYEDLRREVRRFLEEKRALAPEGRGLRIAGAGSPKAIAWQKLLIEHGYAARTIPKEYGGYGAEPDPLVDTILAEEFGRAGASRGVAGQGIDMLVPTLLEHGTEEQKRRYVPPTVRGEMVWCQGYSEPGAGSDLASLKTSAVVEGEEFVIHGQKIWTTTAHVADMMFALVRTEPDAPKHAGISYLLVPMDTPGIDVRPLETMTGHSEFNEVFFDGVRVPLGNLVGRRGEGWKIAATTLKHERNLLGNAANTESMYYGALERMKAETRDGRPAVSDPVLRDRLMRLQARMLAMKFHSMRLLTCRIRGESPGVAGLVTKLVGCQLNHELALLACDAMGEQGVLYGASPRVRDGGSWPFHYMFQLGMIIGGGTAQIQKNIIAERGLGMPREPRVPRQAAAAARPGAGGR